ncbi:hypothetical protein SUNI508_04960 [Seiridium unicorne]|uniref:Uncharacterized protein n=1 Tax=Seiridium unicorne TaxID=138068 RepID=A0ABR2V5Z4_9PEZI
MPTNERVPPVKAQKTERSHEENQERAYIAASRRADRSLEARVQSARMASEIHRRRTGRGLKVTEEIVIKEEMYEEEEDDLPRQFRHLTRHLQTNSPTMNHRVSAYITTQAAMASMARYNEVNRLFNESFPSAAAYQQQLNQSIYMAPLMTNDSTQFSPTSPTMPSPSAQTDGGLTQYGGLDRRISTATTVTTASSTPPALSPGSATMDTPDSGHTPRHSSAHMFPPLDSQPQQHTSSFTSELPNEIRMLGMAKIDMSDSMAPYYFGGDSSSFNLFSHQPTKPAHPDFTLEKSEPVREKEESCSPHDSTNHADEILFSPMEATFGGAFDNFRGMDTPCGGLMADSTWDNLIDFGSEQ